MFRERPQQLVDGPGTIFGGHDYRCLIAAGRRDFLAADNQKTRRIVGIILDILGTNGQSEYFRGFSACHCRSVFILRG